MLNPDERIDIIPGTDYKIIQNEKKFSYGTDAILLSSFARPRGSVVDLGTGTGIIPLRITGLHKLDLVYGIEIQEEVADMATRSVALNGLEEKIKILHMDIKDLKDVFPKSTIDTIVSNPPYIKEGGGLVNPDENFALSRHEIGCSLEDIVEISAYLLKPLGKMYMVHRPDRLVDILYIMREKAIEPKSIQFVYSKDGSKPKLILIEGVKGGRPDLTFYKNLIIYNDDGTYKEEIYNLYGKR